MQETVIRGIRIGYRRQGRGSPLLLLHGGLSDSRSWHRQLEALSDCFEVIAWDAPGCGRSQDPPENYRLSDYADDVAELVDALGLDHPHLLGLSFGGGLALEVFRRHRTLPRTLVLASAYAGWAGSLARSEAQERLERGLELLASSPSALIEAIIPTLFTPSTPQEIVAEERRLMADLHPSGAATMLRAFSEADLRDVLPEIDVPTLLLYGTEDLRSPQSVSESLHSAIAGSELVYIPDAGHVTNLEAPEAFNAAVRRFLLDRQA